MNFPVPAAGPLPPFTHGGVLPPGDYGPTEDEFGDRFVRVPGSSTRLRIYDGWRRLCGDLMDAGLAGSTRQILDGSFTSDKPSPGDLDLAVEVPLTAAEYAHLSEAHPVLALLQGPRMKPAYWCDAYPILVLPAEHPQYDRVTGKSIAYWIKWFGTARDGAAKGRVWTTTEGFA